MEQKDFTIICPCCEANLKIDAQTGAILSQEEKKKQTGSFDEMLKGLDKQKETRDKLFAQELSAQKDRQRLLEEKFQAAVKRVDETDGQPFLNPLDLD